MQKSKRNFVAGIIGNILDRYDVALYGLMASFIGPNFFPDNDPIISTIKAYVIMALGLITRPLGALIFGRLAITIGPRRSMVLALVGVAISTGLIGLVPSCQEIGPSATFIFILVRIAQGIFGAGEHSVAPFFIIQNSPIKKYTRSSAIYSFSTMIGVVIASMAAAMVSKSSDPQYYWRYAYFAGFFTAVVGVYIRMLSIKDAEEVYPNISSREIWDSVKENKLVILRIALVTSFSYITYTIPFVFMNSFIPKITNSVSISDMLSLNSYLLVFDTLLIPVFGLAAERFDRRKFMATMSFMVAASVIPLFYYMEGAGFVYIMFVRVFIILAGLAYLTPLQAWYYDLFKTKEKYLLVGIGCALGDEVLGKNSTAICLTLWLYFGTPVAPAIYICLVASLATFALVFMEDKTRK